MCLPLHYRGCSKKVECFFTKGRKKNICFNPERRETQKLGVTGVVLAQSNLWDSFGFMLGSIAEAEPTHLAIMVIEQLLLTEIPLLLQYSRGLFWDNLQFKSWDIFLLRCSDFKRPQHWSAANIPSTIYWANVSLMSGWRIMLFLSCWSGVWPSAELMLISVVIARSRYMCVISRAPSPPWSLAMRWWWWYQHCTVVIQGGTRISSTMSWKPKGSNCLLLSKQLLPFGFIRQE